MEPRPLVFMFVLFWLSVVSGLIVAFFFRDKRGIPFAILVGTAAILFPVSRTVLILTGWWLHGKAP